MCLSLPGSLHLLRCPQDLSMLSQINPPLRGISNRNGSAVPSSNLKSNASGQEGGQSTEGAVGLLWLAGGLCYDVHLGNAENN